MFLKLVYLFFGVQVYFSVILFSGQRKRKLHFVTSVTLLPKLVQKLSH